MGGHDCFCWFSWLHFHNCMIRVLFLFLAPYISDWSGASCNTRGFSYSELGTAIGRGGVKAQAEGLELVGDAAELGIRGAQCAHHESRLQEMKVFDLWSSFFYHLLTILTYDLHPSLLDEFSCPRSVCSVGLLYPDS